jgi:hypothetical protein
MLTMFEIEAHLRARLESWPIEFAKEQVAIWWMAAGERQPALWLLKTNQLSDQGRAWVCDRLMESSRRKQPFEEQNAAKAGPKVKPSAKVRDWLIAVTIEDRLQNQDTPFGYETSMRTFDAPRGWGGVKLARARAAKIHSEWLAMIRSDAEAKGIDLETHRKTVLEIHKDCMTELGAPWFMGGAEPSCYVLSSPKQPWLKGRGPR